MFQQGVTDSLVKLTGVVDVTGIALVGGGVGVAAAAIGDIFVL